MNKTKQVLLIIATIVLVGLNIFTAIRSDRRLKKLNAVEVEFIRFKKTQDSINQAKEALLDKYRNKIKENAAKQKLNADSIAKLKKQLKKDEQAIIDYPTDFNSKFDILARNLSPN